MTLKIYSTFQLEIMLKSKDTKFVALADYRILENRYVRLKEKTAKGKK